jgi:predicted nucleotidyltransferase
MKIKLENFMLFSEAEQILKGHKKGLSKLGVSNLSVFGSTAKNQGKKKSDVDILVELDPKKGMFGFISLKEYLESILHCDVDLVTKNALHPALKERILRDAKQIF